LLYYYPPVPGFPRIIFFPPHQWSFLVDLCINSPHYPHCVETFSLRPYSFLQYCPTFCGTILKIIQEVVTCPFIFSSHPAPKYFASAPTEVKKPAPFSLHPPLPVAVDRYPYKEFPHFSQSRDRWLPGIHPMAPPLHPF